MCDDINLFAVFYKQCWGTEWMMLVVCTFNLQEGSAGRCNTHCVQPAEWPVLTLPSKITIAAGMSLDTTASYIMVAWFGSTTLSSAPCSRRMGQEMSSTCRMADRSSKISLASGYGPTKLSRYLSSSCHTHITPSHHIVLTCQSYTAVYDVIAE